MRKLSDIRGEDTFDVLADLIDPIANIAADQNASALFRREKLPDGMNAKEFLAGRIRKHLPALMKTHKADIIAILATMEGIPADAYAKVLDLQKLFADATTLLTDDALMAVFTSAQTGASSGSAQENTTVPAV